MSVAAKPNVSVRFGTFDDLGAVAEVARASGSPWTEREIRAFCRDSESARLVVAEQPHETGFIIVGHCLCAVGRHDIHIVDLAVYPDARRTGVGTAMIAAAKARLSKTRLKYIAIEVRESNLEAQQFYRAIGFTCVGTLKRFYQDTGEDAYRMVYCYQHPERPRQPGENEE